MGRIDDGHSTKISFSADATVEFYEKEVTPIGIDGGGANDTTTMRNTEWRTMSPKKLKTLTPCNASVAYDPIVFANPGTLLSLINVLCQITITFADESTLVFWGWLNSFKPNSTKEGDQPTADIEIIPANQNDSGVETAPVWTPAA